jgi:hypothetical protein
MITSSMESLFDWNFLAAVSHSLTVKYNKSCAIKSIQKEATADIRVIFIVLNSAQMEDYMFEVA